MMDSRGGQGRRGGREGQRGQGFGLGGACVCPACGTLAPHKTGIPCLEMKCPQCGAKMNRTGR